MDNNNNTISPHIPVPMDIPVISNTSCQDTLLDCIMEEESESKSHVSPKPIIRKIVCSGGGTFGFIAYGVLKQSCKSGFWNIENIQEMYGTSIGAIMTLLISLFHSNKKNNTSSPLTWDLIDNYLISRPWQNVFKMDILTITNSLENRGIFDKNPVIDIFEPLFKTMELSTNMTLTDHYNLFGIEMHFYSTDLSSMKLVDISYKTHPSWNILDAVYASCSLPILFSPYVFENCTYFDGGLLCNYPMYFCIQNTENDAEIMGLKYCEESTSDTVEHEDTSSHSSMLFDYILTIIKNLTYKINDDYDCLRKIKHEFNISSPSLSMYDIYLAITQSEKRKAMIEDGIQFWNKHGNT